MAGCASAADAAGNLFGTTGSGGAYSWGTVFQITPKDKFFVLHAFTGGEDGGFSTGGLIADESGNLYGTTGKGGAARCGTVFKLTPSHREKVLHTFACAKDGEAPTSSLVMDNAGNLYGTTIIGGVNCAGEGEDLCGTVFRITPSGKKRLLHAFAGGKDGMYPNSPLIRDSSGNLYGTTTKGGGDCDGGTEICGVVFKVTPDGEETIVHTFAGPPSDGYLPAGGLVADEAGNLYGMTVYGGAYGAGTVYRITPDGRESVLHSFADHGRSPWGELVRDGAGNLFGVTNFGGATGAGTVFKLTPRGKEVILRGITATAYIRMRAPFSMMPEISMAPPIAAEMVLMGTERFSGSRSGGSAGLSLKHSRASLAVVIAPARMISLSTRIALAEKRLHSSCR